MNELETIYADLKKAAREIAARQGRPDFDRDFPQSIARSRKAFDTDPYLKGLRSFVREQTENNLGHGLGHARKVALDAGTIAAIEAERDEYAAHHVTHLIFMAHCAGLLHDIRRSRQDHAAEGARAARDILEQNAALLKQADIDAIAFAIKNHEAFKNVSKSELPVDMLMSGCLYDADKFRWGPDNFTHTVWDMVEIAPPPLSKFVYLYPRALDFIAGIKTTFRTPVGRQYGPQFIDTGLAIGRELLEVVKVRYVQYL